MPRMLPGLFDHLMSHGTISNCRPYRFPYAPNPLLLSCLWELFVTKKEISVAAALALFFAIVFAPMGEVSLHFLSWLGVAVAKASTLGLRFLIDAQYANAAKTLGEPNGVSLALSLTCSTIFLMGTVLILAALRASRTLSTPTRTLIEFRHYLLKVSTLTLAPAVVFLLSGAQASYITKLAKDYQRTEILAAPFLSDVDLRNARAEFVLIKSKDEYDRLMAKLNATITQHGGRTE